MKCLIKRIDDGVVNVINNPIKILLFFISSK